MNAAHACSVVYLFQLCSTREYGYCISSPSGNKPHPCILMVFLNIFFSSIHYCSLYFSYCNIFLNQLMYYICSKGINDFAGRYQSCYQSGQATSHFWGLRWHLIFIELILYKSSIRLKLICLYCLYIQFVQWIVMYNTNRISWGWPDLDGLLMDKSFRDTTLFKYGNGIFSTL